jgi:hypothetical protein
LTPNYLETPINTHITWCRESGHGKTIADKENRTKMPHPQQRQRNTKNVRRSHEDQYGEGELYFVRPKTVPTSKLQTLARDYRTPENTQEDYDRTLYKNQKPRHKTSDSSFWTQMQLPHNKWRNVSTCSTTDSESQDKRGKQNYGTFPRHNVERNRQQRKEKTIQYKEPVEYQAYRKTYKFVLTTGEPTTLTGDITHAVYAKIPEETTVSADSNRRGKRGERTYQVDKTTQTTRPWLSTFENSFEEMSM